MRKWICCCAAVAISVTTLARDSCGVEFRYGLSQEDGRKGDERLLGDWRIAYDDGTVDEVIWRVTKDAASPNSMQIEIIGEPSSPPPPHALIHTNTIGPYHYVTISDFEETVEEKTFGIYRYEFSDDNAVVFFGPNVEVFVAAIPAKELCGEVTIKTTKRTPLDYLLARFLGAKPKSWLVTEKTCMVTESTEALTRFLAENGAKCHPDRKDNQLTFKRVRPRDEQAPKQE